MRTLILLRHAKSGWDDPALDDIDRPLSARGERDAPRMGREIAARGWLPELVLCSPARRTRQTIELARPFLPPEMRVSFVTEIYEAPHKAILAVIRTAPPSVKTLMVVGHNPGLEDLAASIAGCGSDPAALARLGRKYPTGAVARFVLDKDWQALGPGDARLTDFVLPKELT